MSNIDDIMELNPKTFQALSKGALGERNDRLNDALMVSGSVKPVAIPEDISSIQNEVDNYVKSISDLAENFGDEKVKAKPSRRNDLKRLAQILYEGR